MFRSLFRSLSRGRRKQHAHDDHDEHDNADTSRGPPTWSRFTESPDAAFGHAHHRRQHAYHDDPDYEDDDAENNDLGHHGDDEDEDDEQQAGGYFSLRPRRDRFDGPSYFDRDPVGHHRYRNRQQEEQGAEDDDDEDYDPDDADPHDDDEDAGSAAPLLPIFSSAHLDGLPLYNITHAIRILIVQRCETTLSWDQLRSPQISQFLVKPIQREVREGDGGLFNRATLCALVANCLQFHKEAQMNPANVGVLRTRALISELLAMRLLREFSSWELIDALSYDFNPLQGVAAAAAAPSPPPGQPSADGLLTRRPSPARVARISTIEVAIRAEAKRFLAHPVVVQHLEAIWAGNIVFHSEQDNLHRKHQQQRSRFRMVEYGTTGKGSTRRPDLAPAGADSVPARRSVTLYDPRDASLFKLSRLRVPRYRQVFSTLSFATMLALFVAVLVDRSLDITPLEVLFWLWSAGYMLDEVVGFTEQGFGLYILSFWNAFDLGILLLFAIYYCLRLYGVVVADTGKHRISSIAYDVLASTAILLFPRLFGVLDHYRYFSQLLIAFRLMAQDLMAILVLIVIFCSGFFVAFTLSFSDDNIDANGVAYILFQIVMGFTPAAWDHWASYNILGQALMALFLIICHFLIVTILITVLTNSFMAIVKNAEAEHQFLFAINTISMVKSDALFSYIAPTNLLGWLLSPLRYAVPLRRYVRFNRTVIKLTHSPVLFVIFAYERVLMARRTFGRTPALLAPHRPPAAPPAGPVAFGLAKAPELFSPGHHSARMREASVISVRKDAALEEVFRRPFRGGGGGGGGDTLRTTATRGPGEGTLRRGSGVPGGSSHHHSKTAVDKWMQIAENAGGPSPPLEQPRSVVDRLEGRLTKGAGAAAMGRPGAGRRLTTAERLRTSLKPSREFSTGTRSVDGQSMRSVSGFLQPPQPHPSRRLGGAQQNPQARRVQQQQQRDAASTGTRPQETDADADVDETVHDETMHEADDDDGDDDSDPSATPPAVRLGESAISVHQHTQTEEEGGGEDDDSESEFFQTPMAKGTPSPFLPARLSHAAEARLRDSPEPSVVPNTPSPLGPQQPGGSGRAARRPHQRLASSGTILFAPAPATSQPRPPASGGDDSTSSSHPRPARPISRKHASPPNKSHSPPLASGAAGGSASRPNPNTSKPSRPAPTPRASRPAVPQRQKTAPSSGGLLHIGGLTFLPPHFPASGSRPRRIAGPRREPSFNARALDLASEIGDNAFTGPAEGGMGLLGGVGAGSLPNSLSEQLVRAQRARPRPRRGPGEEDEEEEESGAAARNKRKARQQQQQQAKAEEDEEQGMVSRIMLARMHTLEEGFREVLREIKELSNSQYPGSSRRDSEIEGPSAVGSGTQPVHVGRGGGMVRPTLATAAPGLGSSSSAPRTPVLGRVAAAGATAAAAAQGGKVGALSSSPRKVAAARKERAAKRASKGSVEGSGGSTTAVAVAAATADGPESSLQEVAGHVAAGEGNAAAQEVGEQGERRPVTAVRKEEEGLFGGDREEEDEARPKE